MHILTDGEAEDVFRGRQSKAKLPCVMADDLSVQQTQKSSFRNKAAPRNRASTNAQPRRCLNAPAAFENTTRFVQKFVVFKCNFKSSPVRGDNQTGYLFVQQPQCIFNVGVL